MDEAYLPEMIVIKNWIVAARYVAHPQLPPIECELLVDTKIFVVPESYDGNMIQIRFWWQKNEMESLVLITDLHKYTIELK